MDTQINTPAEIPVEIRNFLISLLNEAKISPVDEKIQSEMIEELYIRLDNFITAYIIDQLPPEKLEEFTRINEEEKSQVEIEQFLKDNVPNSQEVFTKAFGEFRNLYLENSNTNNI